MKHSTRTEVRDPQEEPSAMAWSLTTITLSPLWKGTSRHNNDTASTTAQVGLYACRDYFCMRQRGKVGIEQELQCHGSVTCIPHRVTEVEDAIPKYCNQTKHCRSPYLQVEHKGRISNTQPLPPQLRQWKCMFPAVYDSFRLNCSTRMQTRWYTRTHAQHTRTAHTHSTHAQHTRTAHTHSTHAQHTRTAHTHSTHIQAATRIRTGEGMGGEGEETHQGPHNVHQGSIHQADHGATSGRGSHGTRCRDVRDGRTPEQQLNVLRMDVGDGLEGAQCTRVAHKDGRQQHVHTQLMNTPHSAHLCGKPPNSNRTSTSQAPRDR